MKKGKSNFQESILITLKLMIVGIIVGFGSQIIRLATPDKPAVMIAYAIFSLWFVGFVTNRLWGWK